MDAANVLLTWNFNANLKNLLEHLCLWGIQKRYPLKPASNKGKSRLQLFFQLFLVFEE